MLAAFFLLGGFLGHTWAINQQSQESEPTMRVEIPRYSTEVEYIFAHCLDAGYSREECRDYVERNYE